MQITLAALVVLGAAGCGANDTATDTVTVTRTESAPAAPTPSEPESPDPSDADSASDSPGPPLPPGVVGVDGRYQLKRVSSDHENQNIGRKRFFLYREPSNAVTKCVGERCSVTFRFGLKSGGSKEYTLRTDPARERTYVGTGTGQVECSDKEDTKVQSRERIAVRAGSPTDIGGRQVAERLSLYATITARCPATNGPGDEAARYVVTLRGPREPPE